MLKNEVIDLRLFSAKDALLSPTSQFDRLRRCTTEAKEFLDAASVSSVLETLFQDESNRRTVLNVVQEILHVGYLVENQPQTIEWLKQFANEVGLTCGHVVFVSTIISHELGLLCQRPEVATTIFKAFEKEDGPSNYIEVLIPDAESEVATSWITQEVGSHIGFTLHDPSLYPAVREAFLAEGFEIPAFMKGKPMTNTAVGASAIYFDKMHDGRIVRIELCNCEACM